MKIIIFLSFMITLNIYADLFCEQEFSALNCDAKDISCIMQKVQKADQKCHEFIKSKTQEELMNDPCVKAANACGLKATEECLSKAPLECQDVLKKQQKAMTAIKEKCDFSAVTKNCASLMDPSDPMKNMNKQVECFEREKDKLGHECKNLLENIGK